MKKNNKNGFTLIELIMVMIILGILSAVAIPRTLLLVYVRDETERNIKKKAERGGFYLADFLRRLGCIGRFGTCERSDLGMDCPLSLGKCNVGFPFRLPPSQTPSDFDEGVSLQGYPKH